MARSVLNALIVDSTGIVQAGASVTVYEADGATPLIQSMYAALSGGTALANPTVTNNIGRLVLYADTAQRVVIKPTGGTPTVAEFEPDPADLVKVAGSTLTGGTFVGGVFTSPTINTPVLAAGGIALSRLTPGSSGFLKSDGAVITAGNTIPNSSLTIPFQCLEAVPSTSTPTTASSSYATMAEMSVSITTTGGVIAVWGNAALSNSGLGNFTVIALALDGAAEVAEQDAQSFVATDYQSVTVFKRFAGVVAGAHTVTLRWKALAGTSTNDGVKRGLMVMEIPL